MVDGWLPLCCPARRTCNARAVPMMASPVLAHGCRKEETRAVGKMKQRCMKRHFFTASPVLLATSARTLTCDCVLASDHASICMVYL
eukprot:SAG31_NODE_15665_length_743_cov_48.914596_1_plen_86_part_01